MADLALLSVMKDSRPDPKLPFRAASAQIPHHPTIRHYISFRHHILGFNLSRSSLLLGHEQWFEAGMVAKEFRGVILNYLDSKG